MELNLGGFQEYFSELSRYLRNILGISWPETITNQELWERTEQSDINVEIKRRKFGWIRHTLQKSENEICHAGVQCKNSANHNVNKVQKVIEF
jgi:hypothetical protein